jgi:hypothetical protein
MMESALLVLGISILYFGFSAAFGLLLRRLLQHPADSVSWIAGFLYALFIIVPASVVVINLGSFPHLVRVVIVLAGCLIACATALQPGWIPPETWQQPVRGGFLALAMGFAALWSINYALTSDSNLTLLLGLAAASAAFASARSSLRPG